MPGAGRATRWQGASQETGGKVAPEVDADHVIGGNAYINGQIKTGSFNTDAADRYGSVFGGLEREVVVWPSGMFRSPDAGAVFTFGSGVPRIVLPNGATTTIYTVFEICEWWLPSTLGIYFEWCNDHSATGEVLWNCQVREYDIGTQGPADGELIGSRLVIIPDVPAGKSTTTEVGSVQLGNQIKMTPGPFASFYTLMIQRIADNPADTLEGPIGFICASMTRGQ